MPLVHIIETSMSTSAALSLMLGRRRIGASCGDKPVGGCQVLVLSGLYEKTIGGLRGVVELARQYGAKTIVIVTEEAEIIEQTEDLGGRILRVSLPTQTGTPPHLRDCALLYLTDIVASGLQSMVAADPSTGQLLDLAARVAKTDVTVFIHGPTGSGKEVLARQVHAASRRANAPFVAINCAAIPENMLEAILFGHEKGAFTGAQAANKGLIRAADGGTLLLDEISEMPMGLQSKLLRVLQERTVTPIGSQAEVAVDIRIIATSNRNMAEEVAARRFREDLYYRLNVFPLATKALSDRPDDIPVLAASLIRRHLGNQGTLPLLTAEAMSALCGHKWNGNVRELENVIQRAIVLYADSQITAQDIVIDMDCLSQPLMSMAEAV
ncbi:sigma 54-interacting transcriptional regulator [Thioclava sp. FR2]|uniref:sigma 54-interacting transcriptional regulator n=1 Tax=Thioclava sp. FR2 TaxID=3445780 RepID=UPI003EB861D1